MNDFGPSPLVKDVALSRFWAKRIRAKPQECWKNAALVAMTSDEGSPIYVEGLVVFTDSKILHLVSIEHGWLEIDGRIVDPTLPDKPGFYFPACRYTGEELTRLMGRKTKLNLPLNDYRRRTLSEAYTQNLNAVDQWLAKRFAETYALAALTKGQPT